MEPGNGASRAHLECNIDTTPPPLPPLSSYIVHILLLCFFFSSPAFIFTWWHLPFSGDTRTHSHTFAHAHAHTHTHTHIHAHTHSRALTHTNAHALAHTFLGVNIVKLAGTKTLDIGMRKESTNQTKSSLGSLQLMRMIERTVPCVCYRAHTSLAGWITAYVTN